MNTTRTIAKLFTAFSIIALCLAPSKSTAQTSKLETSVVKDGYVMMDGKMMALKDGKLAPMKKKVVMSNGTKVSKSGVVKTTDGKKVKMKDGNCVDNTGKVDDCNVNADYYTCTHHPDVRAAKDGKCPKCGMDLVLRDPKKK
ncbi:MAG TPA: DUF6799 domain-containing protein [Flavobacterium sp.]|jgi:hypothetical protein